MKIEATEEQPLISAIADLHDWIESMVNYNDAQYGKGKIKSLHNRLICSVLRKHGESCVVDVVMTKTTSWTWNFKQFEFKTFLPAEGSTEATFSVCTNGIATITFDAPCRGLLVLQRKEAV